MYPAILLILIFHDGISEASATTITQTESLKSKQTKRAGGLGCGSNNSTKSCNKMYTVRGQLKFGSNGAPNSIPDGSTLTVKLQDTSRMDAPAIELGKMVKQIKNHKNGDVLSFEISTDKRPQLMEASLSAVLNIGWTPSGDEWIRKGDWLNDTHHPVQLQSSTNEYTNDVEIINYT